MTKRQKYYKQYRKSWREPLSTKVKHRDSNSRLYLRKASKIGHLVSGGWPDAGRTEQKIGTGFVTSNQWLRAAWAEGQGTAFWLLFAKTQEDAIYEHRCEIVSFRSYARKLGMLKEWNKLVNHLIQRKRRIRRNKNAIIPR